MKSKYFIQIFFSLLILSLGAWAFYEYKKSQTEEQIKKSSSSLFSNLELKQIQSLKIIKNKEEMQIIQKEGDWLMEKPVKDIASFSEVSRWFSEIKNQQLKKVNAKQPIDWKNYYLDFAPRVEILPVSGEKISFSVSNKSSFDDKYFIKKESELFIGESYFFSEVNEVDFNAFRSKKILPPVGHAMKIQFQGKKNFTLHWRDHKWTFEKVGVKKFPLDSKKSDDFWKEINSMQALEIKSAVQADSLRKYGLHKPLLRLSLTYLLIKEPYTLKLSPIKKDKAFVSVSHRDFIFEISKEMAEKFLLSLNDLKEEDQTEKTQNKEK